MLAYVNFKVLSKDLLASKFILTGNVNDRKYTIYYENLPKIFAVNSKLIRSKGLRNNLNPE